VLLPPFRLRRTISFLLTTTHTRGGIHPFSFSFNNNSGVVVETSLRTQTLCGSWRVAFAAAMPSILPPFVERTAFTPPVFYYRARDPSLFSRSKVTNSPSRSMLDSFQPGPPIPLRRREVQHLPPRIYVAGSFILRVVIRKIS